VIPGHPQHVIQRGNNREPIFCQDADYSFYLEKLAAACRKFECDLHAYVLMTNHMRLLGTPHTINEIGKVMQSLGRYEATLVDSEPYLLTCMRYIELNPVRAGMLSHPKD
jgi:putative transposase